MQLAKFGIVGVVATVVHVFVFTVAVELLESPPVLAVVLAFCLAALVSFFGHRRWTFSVEAAPGQLLRFFVVALTGLTMNVLVTYVTVDILNYWYGIAVILSITLVPGVTFALSKYWAFSSRR